jgi:hypothetical protein
MKLSDITKGLFSAKKAQGESLEPIKEISEQTPDEKKLVEYIKEKIDSVRQTNSRIAIEGVYMCNVAYLLGFDGVYYDTTYRQFRNVDPKRKLSRNRFKVNKILPTIQNRLSRLTQNPPRYEVRPNSNSTEDKDAARLGLEVIESIYEAQRFTEKRQDALMMAMQGGHAYIQVVWDPTLGKPMMNPQTGEFEGYEGDVKFEVLNCLEVFPDPLAKNIDECQYLIKAKTRKLEYFRARYPERGNLVKEESTWLLSSTYDMKTNSLTSVGIVGAQTHDQMKNSAIEIVYYEKRSKDHPNGRRIVTANGVLLSEDELPVGEFDIVKIDDMIIGGRYNSEAIITHLRPIQDQYNVSRTKMADWVRKMLAGKYLVAKGSGLGQESLNNDSGEVVEFNPVPNAPPPTAMTIPQIPSYAYKDIETLDGEFDFVSGINEISRGVLPSASIPAQGMAFLQEQDQTRIGVQTQRNESAYARVGCLVLKYVGKNYVLPRMLKIAGDGLGYTVKEFIGQDLKDNYDVKVIEGSTIPQSKVLRNQEILSRFQMGLLGNPQDPKVIAKVLKMTEYGDANEIWKKQALDEAQVKRVIKAIEEEDQVALRANMNEFDNHALHLEIMNEYRLQDKFMNMSDKQKSIFFYVMEWRINAATNILNPGLQQTQNMAENAINQIESGNAPPVDMQGQAPVPPEVQATPPSEVPNMNQILAQGQQG